MGLKEDIEKVETELKDIQHNKSIALELIEDLQREKRAIIIVNFILAVALLFTILFIVL